MFAIYKSESSRLKDLSKYDSLKEEDWKGEEFYPTYDINDKPLLSDDNEEDEKEDEYSKNGGVSNQDKLLAYKHAMKFVKDKLISPSSAEFPEYYEHINHVLYLGERRFFIESWVDSQNSFGAMIRSKFTCQLSYSNDMVHLTEINIE